MAVISLIFYFAAATASPTYRADIAPIFEAKCLQCHNPSGHARFLDLSTYKEAKSYAHSISVAIMNKTMPPWMEVGTRHFLNDISLTSKESETILAWTKLPDPPEGSASRDPAPGFWRRRSLGAENADYKRTAPRAYMPADHSVSVRCFLFDWPYKEDRFTRGIYVEHAAPWQVAHSLVMYLNADNAARLLREKKAHDFDCWDMSIYKYNPRPLIADVGVFPQDTGIHVNAGGALAIEVHYDTTTADSTEADRPKISVITAKTVKHPAAFVNWMPRVEELKVPADSKDYSIRQTERLSDKLAKMDPEIFARRPKMRLYQLGFHMHDTGSDTRLSILRHDQTINIARIEKWRSTGVYEFWPETPVEILPRDRLQLECRYDNTAANPLRPLKDGHSRTLSWGWEDEMCVAFMYVSIGG